MKWKPPPAQRGRQIVIPEKKLAIFTIPKCASGAIASTVQRAMGNHDWQQLRILMPMQPALWEGWQEYERVAVIRNPYDRFVSGFSFMTKGKGDLAMYLDKICETPDWNIDQHYQSQSRYLTHDGEIVANRLIRFDRLAEGWAKLAEDLEWLKLLPLEIRNQSPAKYELTWNQKRRLRKRYADDFDLYRSL